MKTNQEKYFNNIKKSWYSFLDNEFKKEYFSNLLIFLDNEYNTKIIYPNKKQLFRCFSYFDIEETRLVILGQDPYHVENMADGLAFSTNLKICPKSLCNIFKELDKDFAIKRTNFDLTNIAKQGVLLLNTILTVEKSKPLSHKSKGWEIFTQNLLEFISTKNKNIIYLLMGNNAISYKVNIKNSLGIFETSHPSPYSYHINLKNSSTFKKINNLLVENNIKPIDWSK